ncbi:hypothetical protein GGI20_005035 [Coemansia sp. BCRC 34301]|nr:hypothetical protein GGI20_005035 [Coemansia sp. BCRC 34301]
MDLAAPARILATSEAPNIVAEVTRDLLARWEPSEPLLKLLHLGQYVATIRARHQPSLHAVLLAAKDAPNPIPAMALVGGIAVALGSSNDPAVLRRFVALAVSASTARDSREAIGVCAQAVAGLGSWARQHVTRQLAQCEGSTVLLALAGAAFSSTPNALGADLIVELIYEPGTQFAAGQRVVQAAHAWATAQLLAYERNGSKDTLCSAAALRVLDAVLRRFYASGQASRSRDSAWLLIVDTLAVLYPVTLRDFGRDAQPESLLSACSLAIGYALGSSDIDSLVKALFAAQPCLREHPGAIGGPRSGVVLFYLDLLEHLAAGLSPHITEFYVAPVAARYAVGSVLVYPGPPWFESAHALVLAVLDADCQPISGEIASWYAHLVLDMYPDHGISADLLRISYTASVRASSTPWDLVTVLLRKTDSFSDHRSLSHVRKELHTVRYRDLLIAVCELFVSVPAELLPQLMVEIGDRVGLG